jgi:hypothetical protein
MEPTIQNRKPNAAEVLAASGPRVSLENQSRHPAAQIGETPVQQLSRIDVQRQPNGVTAFSGGRVAGQPAYEGAQSANFRPGAGAVNTMSAQNFTSASPSMGAAVSAARAAAVARGEPVTSGAANALAQLPAQQQAAPTVVGDGGGYGILSKEYQAQRNLRMDMERGLKESSKDYAARINAVTGNREIDAKDRDSVRRDITSQRGQDMNFGSDAMRESGANARAALGEQGNNARAALTAGIQFGELDLKRQALGQRKDAPSATAGPRQATWLPSQAVLVTSPRPCASFPPARLLASWTTAATTSVPSMPWHCSTVRPCRAVPRATRRPPAGRALCPTPS